MHNRSSHSVAVAVAVVLGAVATLASFAGAAADEDHDRGAEARHVAVLDGVRIVHAWTRATDGDEVLVWMEIENRGDATIAFTGAESQLAREGAVVGHRMVEGEARNEVIAEIAVGSGEKIVFEPNGLALRLTGLTRSLQEGDVLEVTVLTSAGPLEIEADVEAASARSHGHAGHTHDRP